MSASHSMNASNSRPTAEVPATLRMQEKAGTRDRKWTPTTSGMLTVKIKFK
jgi:hypothetical protein